MTGALTQKKQLRRQAIIDIACTAFLKNGYAATTMSSIAEQLGGSKTTLWRYFPSKQDLFVAVMDNLIGTYVDTLSNRLILDGDIGITLQDFGEELLQALMQKPIIDLIRLVTGEAGRFPEIAELFHRRGRGRGLMIIQAYMDAAVERGDLRDTDTSYAAQHFIALCRCGCYQRYLSGGGKKPGKAQIRQDINAAVSAFLRVYGTGHPSDSPSG